VESNNTDESDWRAACGGDGSAFARVFDRYADRLARHAWRLVPTADDVEDVVAVTFMEAWRRRDSIRFVEGSILPWLLVTATNSARNVSRAARRHRALLERLPRAPAISEGAGYHEEGPTQIALRSLSLADQRLLTLCDVYGYSGAEAAFVLGVSGTAIRSRLSRARARLASVAGSSAVPGFAEGENS
jgi:RNA polymerase sigma-70 factor (ECF subfamily)